MEAYCLKCRTKREMQNEQQITMSNGKPATQGVCPVCGTKMFKIGSGGGASAGGATKSTAATKTKAAAKDTAEKATKTAGTRAKAPAKK